MLGRIVNKVAGGFGLRIERVDETRASVTLSEGEYAGLMLAYETLLRERDGAAAIPLNAKRPVLMGRLVGTLPPEAFAIVEALIRTRDVDGDVCEFGVAQGRTSALIANELTADDRTFHLFDSFEGMPAPTKDDALIDDPSELGSLQAYEGTWSFPEASVRARLREVDFPDERTRIHAGFVEDVVERDADLPEAVSFAYLDFDFYQPIRVTLDFLHERLAPGAMVIVDDYGFFSSGAQKAVDGFIAERNRAGAKYAMQVADESFGRFATITRLP